VRASLGAVLDGTLEGDGRSYDIAPGLVGSIGVAKQWRRNAWFAIGSFGVAASRTTTTESAPAAQPESLIALDVARLGATFGRTLDIGVGVIAPYVLARGFGGPVLWTLDATDVTGTDVYHFQVGAGASATLGAVSMMLDIAALGERSASISVSYRL
jgi:hypothetical protein